MKKYLNVKTIIFTILIIILLLLIPKIYGLILILFGAYIIAAALNPYVNALENKIKNRALAATIVVFISTFAVIALILPIIIMCVKELHLLIVLLPQKLTTLDNFLNHLNLYGHKLSDFMPSIGNVLDASAGIAPDVFSKSIDFTVGIFQTAFILIAMGMFVFYIILDKKYLRAKFIEFFPPNIKPKASRIISDITYQVGNYVRAQILSMIAVGVMVALSLAVLGIDYQVLLGLIAGVCDIIPVLGPTIALITIIAIAFPSGIVKVVFAVILFLAAQQISNYVIRPFLFGKFMKLHPITILVALFVAQQFLGVWGVILSPAIAATICVLVDELYLNPINEKETSNFE